MRKANLDSIVASARSKKKEVRIGIDIDNTLVHIPVIAYVNRKFGTDYKESDFTEWGLTNFPKEIAEDVRMQFTNPDFMCRARGYIWAFPTVRDWAAQGYKLFGVTRRTPNLIRGTYDQIEREFPGLFQDIFFVNPSDSKARFLKKIDAEVHIDDWDVEDSLRAGIKTWLITNEHTAYNHGFRSNTRLNQALELRYVKLDETKWKQ